MGIIQRIADYFGDFAAIEARSNPQEQRAKEVSWDALRGGVDIGGTTLVNPRMAEN